MTCAPFNPYSAEFTKWTCPPSIFLELSVYKNKEFEVGQLTV